MTDESLREMVTRLVTSANALAALGVALDAHITGVAIEPALRPHVDAVLDALGARDALATAPAADLRPLLAEVRVFTLLNAKLLDATSRGAGWSHAEPEILVEAGEFSGGLPNAVRTRIAPNLEGLSERLASPGASFLDVGVGVGVIAVGMAHEFPALRVVGVDPYAPALALARDRVSAAGLEARVELREQRGEDVPDVDAFDLAWIPSVFVPERQIPATVARVHRALRPGGWLLFPTLRDSGDPLATALMRLRVASFGGVVTTPERVEAQLQAAGFVDVRSLPTTPGAVMCTFAARRRS